MTPERIEELVSQGLAFDAVADPRGQVEMTIRQAIKEARDASIEECARYIMTLTWHEPVQIDVAYAIRSLKRPTGDTRRD